GSERVPRVRAALARIEVSARLLRLLAGERLARFVIVSACQRNQAEEPVQADGAEPGGRGGRIARQPGPELARGIVEGLAGDEYGGRQPVRERKSGQQCERAPRLAQALLAPARVGETQVMTPVVGFERDAATKGRQRILLMTRTMKHEPERRPGFAVLAVQTA